MASMEENFPRGGIQKKPTETTGKKAKPKFEQDNLFDVRQEFQPPSEYDLKSFLSLTSIITSRKNFYEEITAGILLASDLLKIPAI